MSVEWCIGKSGCKGTRKKSSVRKWRWDAVAGYNTLVKESLGFLEIIGIWAVSYRRDPVEEQEAEDKRSQEEDRGDWDENMIKVGTRWKEEWENEWR